VTPGALHIRAANVQFSSRAGQVALVAGKCALKHIGFQSKAANTKPVVATKALINKLQRAPYNIMRDQVAFDADKLFR
jgi:hypothetical protein